VTRRSIHYEAAFEDYLRSRGLAYVAVDEQRKAIFSGARVKSFDFLVYCPTGPAWLVDVKGRKFPYDQPAGRRYWENWVTVDDLEGLAQWQRAFGDGFQAMLVFAYWLTAAHARSPTSHVHRFRDEHYSFLCIPADQYREHSRGRSAKWNTVSMPARDFRKLAKPANSCWSRLDEQNLCPSSVQKPIPRAAQPGWKGSAERTRATMGWSSGSRKPPGLLPLNAAYNAAYEHTRSRQETKLRAAAPDLGASRIPGGHYRTRRRLGRAGGRADQPAGPPETLVPMVVHRGVPGAVLRRGVQESETLAPGLMADSSRCAARRCAFTSSGPPEAFS